MHKKILLVTTLLSTLSSNPFPYTMYANKVISEEGIVRASGGVIIFHNDKVYRSNSAVYDKNRKVLDLYGGVYVVSKENRSKTDHLRVDIKKSDSKTEKFFIYSGSDGLWLRGASYSGNGDIYVVKNSEVSSCQVKNPDWKILFSKGKYSKKYKFLSLTKPTFYFKGVPVFGLPWFGFPTIKKRTSGVLRPKLGIRAESGFIYMQPYFYAPQKDWDITITPQFRTNRGVGLYSELNFVDSKYSKGKVTTGYFSEKDSFFKKKGLKNKKHYGLDVFYESDSFLPSLLKKNYKDGFYLNLKTLNDIDYENLKDTSINSYNKLVTSRMNYFLQRDRDYFGLYAKYFIDTDKVNNSDTMQELPSLQYHIFTKNFLVKNLTYSFDYKLKNNYRRKGLNAIWHEMNLPFKFDVDIFDNFLNFSVSENLYYSKVQYGNRSNQFIKNAKYFSNYHKFVLSSDLSKKYDNFFHNLQLSASLQVPSFEDKSGDFADFININKERKNLNLSINQYFYNQDGLDFLNIRTSEIIYLDKQKREYGDVLNDITYKYSSNLSISENTVYSREHNKFKRFQTTINYNDDIYNFNLSHTYQSLPSTKKVNYLTSSFSAKLYHGYRVGASINRDIKEGFDRDRSLWIFRDKGCWNYKIKYKESLIPIQTSGGAKAYRSRGIYFLVNFANIGGVSYDFSKDDIIDSGVDDEQGS